MRRMKRGRKGHRQIRRMRKGRECKRVGTDEVRKREQGQGEIWGVAWGERMCQGANSEETCVYPLYSMS